jgi:hypothetical protein
MSKRAEALKSALDLSEAEHARRGYASSAGMVSPARLLKTSRLHSPGSGKPGARKKHASRTSPSREAAPSRFGCPTEDGTAVAHLNFDGDASGMCAAGRGSLMECISVTRDGDFNRFFADDISEDDGGAPNGQWFTDIFGSGTSSSPNGHMSEWSSPWHHLSSSPKFLPCCGHAMASFVRRQAQSQAPSLVLSVEIQPVGQNWRSDPQWSRAVAPGWGP